MFSGSGSIHEIEVHADSNWAACLDTRISVSAGVIMCAGGVVKTWSRDQNFQSLSSAEAELYAANLGAQQAIGVQTMLKEMGINAEIVLNVDASAAIGILSRRGLGKMRHIHVNELWLQQKLAKSLL